jgi:hypothetical protein
MPLRIPMTIVTTKISNADRNRIRAPDMRGYITLLRSLRIEQRVEDISPLLARAMENEVFVCWRGSVFGRIVR